MRNRTLATYLGASIAAIAAAGDIEYRNTNTIEQFYTENPPQPEEPQRSRYGGKKERERRARQLAKQQGA